MSVYIPDFDLRDTKKPSKYHNQKVEIDGHTFDSKAEAARYRELQIMQRAGAIKSFSIQPSFVLSEGIRYRPDFIVWDGQTVWVEDVKGVETKDFKLKAKLFKQFYPYLELRVIK
jgi:Protein of unknown function (DUF1064).